MAEQEVLEMIRNVSDIDVTVSSTNQPSIVINGEGFVCVTLFKIFLKISQVF